MNNKKSMKVSIVAASALIIASGIYAASAIAKDSDFAGLVSAANKTLPIASNGVIEDSNLKQKLSIEDDEPSSKEVIQTACFRGFYGSGSLNCPD